MQIQQGVSRHFFGHSIHIYEQAIFQSFLADHLSNQPPTSPKRISHHQLDQIIFLKVSCVMNDILIEKRGQIGSPKIGICRERQRSSLLQQSGNLPITGLLGVSLRKADGLEKCGLDLKKCLFLWKTFLSKILHSKNESNSLKNHVQKDLD